MAGSGIRWVTPPSELAKAIEKYGDRVMVAVKAIADYIATQAQNDMRANAPWSDRTGNARSGLFSVAEMAAKDVVIIYFSHGHTVWYGIYLEVAHGGRWGIIAPTMERIYPQLRGMLSQLFG
jgi:hypothetical protein